MELGIRGTRIPRAEMVLMISINPSYLYRGTTVGWAGSKMLQDENITCTTTDPLIATFFAIECRNHGRAVILAARRELFRELHDSQNYFSVIEAAVDLQIGPAEFARMAEIELDVEKSIEILHELGIRDISVRLAGYDALQIEIRESHAAGLRLSVEQIRLFDTRMFESTS
jgi:hypothetical protein